MLAPPVPVDRNRFHPSLPAGCSGFTSYCGDAHIAEWASTAIQLFTVMRRQPSGNEYAWPFGIHRKGLKKLAVRTLLSAAQRANSDHPPPRHVTGLAGRQHDRRKSFVVSTLAYGNRRSAPTLMVRRCSAWSNADGTARHNHSSAVQPAQPDGVYIAHSSILQPVIVSQHESSMLSPAFIFAGYATCLTG